MSLFFKKGPWEQVKKKNLEKNKAKERLRNHWSTILGEIYINDSVEHVGISLGGMGDGGKVRG